MSRKFDLNDFFEQLKITLSENYDSDGLDSEIFLVDDSNIDVFLDEISLVAKNIINSDHEDFDASDDEVGLETDMFLFSDDEELD